MNRITPYSSLRLFLRSTPIGEISFKTPSPFIRILIRRFHQSQSTYRLISPLSILIGGDLKIQSRRIVLIQWFGSRAFKGGKSKSPLWHNIAENIKNSLLKCVSYQLFHFSRLKIPFLILYFYYILVRSFSS